MITDFFINGQYQHNSKEKYKVFAKYNGSEIATIPDANLNDVELAVQSAKRAYDEVWRDLDPMERAKLMWRWADVIDEFGEEIAGLSGLESGKATIGGDMTFFSDIVRYYAGWIDKQYGDVVTTDNGFVNYVIRQPLGVVAAMPSWNTTVHGAIQKIAPALSTGNTVIVRAPDEAPLSCLALAQTVQKAGFPAGVINIIAGNGPLVSKTLVDHPLVDVITFTGSVEVGKAIITAGAKTMKRTVVELGGKSPFIVFEDADIERAARTAVECGYAYQGQICSAVSRVLVQRSIQKVFVERMKALTEEYRPAFPDEKTTYPAIGPLFNAKQMDRVQRYVDIGKKEGKLITGGNRITMKPFDTAYYFEPTIFEFEDNSSALTREEIFGPVISVIPFDTIEEAIRIANDVPYGLSASVWSNDNAKLFQCSNKVQAGTIWANAYYQYSRHAPWGGFKASGHGREYGKYALEAFTDYKNIWVNK